MENKRTEIESLGEFGLIKVLTAPFKNKNESTIKGVGDDAAIIDIGNEQVMAISTDMLVEGIHFDLTYTPLKHLGYKAVVVNLSDIYAMNVIPQQITVSIAISNRFSLEALEEIYEGIRLACLHYEVDLIGGDTTTSLKGLIISITALGKANKNEVVYRNTAKKNDLICVTGDLGAAYLGLQLLEREKQIFMEHPEVQPDLENQSYLVGRLLKPEARKDIIKMLRAEKIKPTSMIDISDGLSSEILHIATQSNLGCILFEDELPIANDTLLKAFNFGFDTTTCALNGGEDYELLFTVDEKIKSLIDTLPEISIIGKMTDENKGYKLSTKQGNIYDLEAQGWNVFLEAKAKAKNKP